MARHSLLPLSLLLAATATSLAAVSAHAQVYAGTDAGGTLVLSNHASDVATQLLIDAPPSPVTAGVSPEPAAQQAPTRSPLTGEIRAAARRHDVPESLLAAVIAVESGFNSMAVSPKGAKGLMQLMPATARRFGVKDVFAVEENLNGGAAYLRWLLTQFDNDLRLALAAYNAGEGAVARARGMPPYPETRDYVAKVLARMASH